MSICSVSAQDWYVGGSLGLKVYSDSNEGEEQSWFSLNPEVGYNLSDKWAVGTRLKFYYRQVRSATPPPPTSVLGA